MTPLEINTSETTSSVSKTFSGRIFTMYEISNMAVTIQRALLNFLLEYL